MVRDGVYRMLDSSQPQANSFLRNELWSRQLRVMFTEHAQNKNWDKDRYPYHLLFSN